MVSPTHLLKSGTNLIDIQVLFGHKSSKTAEISTYASNKKIDGVKSPTDNLWIKGGEHD